MPFEAAVLAWAGRGFGYEDLSIDGDARGCRWAVGFIASAS